MNTKCINLTNDQQEIFTDAFYEAWSNCESFDGYKPDMSSPTPYGCPWFYNESLVVDTSDIKKSASDYFLEIMDEIAEVLKEEEFMLGAYKVSLQEEE